MTKLENSAASDESQKIVKLRVDGSSSAVNTIQDNAVDRGISLVCPFPALECDMPVSFKGHDGGPSVRGTIHRIGVEDDPETGLPRLRLSIRTHTPAQRDTLITSTPKELLDDAAEEQPVDDAAEEQPVEDAAEEQLESEKAPEQPIDLQPSAANSDPWTPQRDSWSSLEFDLSEERTGKYEKRRSKSKDVASYLSGASYLAEQNGEDPAWVSCSELPCAEEIVNRARTRRRKKLAGAVVWMGMILSAGAGIYSLHRAGVIDMTDVKSMVSGITVTAVEEPTDMVVNEELETQGETASEEQAPVVTGVGEQAPARVLQRETEPASPQQPVEKKGEEADAGYAATHERLHGASAQESATVKENAGAEEDSVKESAKEESAAIEKKQTKTAQARESKAQNAKGGVDPNDVTLMLPTRWPAEYATAYRVRDPNGVVVDVPGGLVKREGWMESLNDHPMIRSVKALQRETGARFIVYVHGSLPRFITTPEGKGVALRLYHESKDDSKAADEVAMLR